MRPGQLAAYLIQKRREPKAIRALGVGVLTIATLPATVCERVSQVRRLAPLGGARAQGCI